MGVQNMTDEELMKALNTKPKMSERVQKSIRTTAESLKEDRTAGEYLKETVSNIPSSAKQLGSDLYQAFSNPIDTLGTIGKTAIGAGQLLYPGKQSYEPYAEAVGEHFGSRYGGGQEVLDTLRTDPVGMLSDVAGAFSGVGMAPKLGTLGKIGSVIDPASAAMNIGAKGIMNAPKIGNVPSSMYQGAAKFYKNVDAPAVTETAMKHGIMPTAKGMTKADAIIDNIGSQVDTLIEQSTNANKAIRIDDILSYADEAKKNIGTEFDAPGDIKKIDKMVTDYSEYMQSQGKTTLTPAEAQAFKRSLYDRLKYGAPDQKSYGTDKARKALARGAKEQIEKIIPEVKGLNMSQGEVLELMEALKGPVARIERRNILDIGTPIKSLAGGDVAGLPGAAGGAALGILDRPKIKARLALRLNDIKKMDISDAKKRTFAIEAFRNAAIIGEEE